MNLSNDVCNFLAYASPHFGVGQMAAIVDVDNMSEFLQLKRQPLSAVLFGQ